MSRAQKREIKNTKKIKLNKALRVTYMFFITLLCVLCLFEVDKSGKEMLGYENYTFKNFIESLSESMSFNFK